MSGFEKHFNTQGVLCIVSRYHLILDKFYVMFQDYHLGVFMVIVYNAPVSLTSVFKPCYSPDLERADFGRQRFQYTWLNSYFFKFTSRIHQDQTYLAIKELPGSCDIVRSLLQQLSLSLWHLVSLDTTLWYRATHVVTLSIPTISLRGGYIFLTSTSQD